MDDKSKGSRDLPSRIEEMRTLRKLPNFDPPMPPIEAGRSIVDHLFEFGPVKATDMGLIAIDHENVGWYQHNLGIELEPWICRLLVQLSREYLAEHHRAKKIDCPEPWVEESLTAVPSKPPMTDLQRHMRMLAQT